MQFLRECPPLRGIRQGRGKYLRPVFARYGPVVAIPLAQGKQSLFFVDDPLLVVFDVRQGRAQIGLGFGGVQPQAVFQLIRILSSACTQNGPVSSELNLVI